MNNNFDTTNYSNRLGMHYISDTAHYRQKDLDIWLPKLKALGTGWLVLTSPQSVAIPETFITGLLQASIQPILRFDYALESPPKTAEISMLFEAYAHWGVKYVILFDRPNLRKSWKAGWARQALVERFLDRFIPLAKLALQNGLMPVFPALEPGGDYWDIAFLNSCLQGLQNRRQNAILENLVLSAYGYTFNHDLNWGAGGPDRWPNARPYSLENTFQDQRGFRNFDWVNAIVESITGSRCPIIILEAGLPNQNPVSNDSELEKIQAATNLAILRLLENDLVEDPQNPEYNLEPIPSNVIACNFWLLASPQADVYNPFVWFDADQNPSPSVDAVAEWQSTWIKSVPSIPTAVEGSKDGFPGLNTDTFEPIQDFDPSMDFDSSLVEKSSELEDDELLAKEPQIQNSDKQFVIQHYVLLPAYEWGIADFYLDVVRPFVKKYHATVGFSLEEAAASASVTVIGDQESFSDEELDKLRFNGAIVERINGDGTTIASVLAQR